MPKKKKTTKKKSAMKANKCIDKLIAYHEAGHAVMAFHKGGTFDFIAITDIIPEWHGAIMNLTWPSKKGTRRNRGLVDLAGMSAVAILRQCRDEYHEDRNQSDFQKFCKLWRTEKQGLNNWPKFYLEGVNFLGEKMTWKQVERVAKTLLMQRILLYDEVQLCIESVVDKERQEDFELYLEVHTRTAKQTKRKKKTSVKKKTK